MNSRPDDPEQGVSGLDVLGLDDLVLDDLVNGAPATWVRRVV